MKNFYLVFTTMLFTQILTAQIVNIPDANFKKVLTDNKAINTNSDAEIQISEAIAYTATIDCSSRGITNLTGIEVFLNIKKLECYSNQLTTLDVSKNVNLTDLDSYSNKLTTLDVSKNVNLTNLFCSSNQLTTLDVSKNINLTNLVCSSNQLTTLDVSKNINLTSLSCSYNQLITLGVSKNVNLSALKCYSNQLITLDVSKNVKLTLLDSPSNQLVALNLKNGNNAKLIFDIRNNPKLKCIEIDDPNKTYNNWFKDTIAIYSLKCNVTTNDLNASAIAIFPNPTSNQITITTDAIIKKYRIINTLGKVIQSNTFNNPTLNVSDLPIGIYYLHLYTDDQKQVVKKFMVE